MAFGSWGRQTVFQQFMKKWRRTRKGLAFAVLEANAQLVTYKRKTAWSPIGILTHIPD